MAFAADARVRVTDQHLVARGRLGTVEVAAADSADGFNKVRLDGAQVGRTENFSDAQLTTSTLASPVTYS